MIIALLLQVAALVQPSPPIDVREIIQHQDAANAAQAGVPAAAQVVIPRRVCAGGLSRAAEPAAVYRGEPGATLNPVWVPGQYKEEGFYHTFEVPGPDGCPQAKPMQLPYEGAPASPVVRPRIKLSDGQIY